MALSADGLDEIREPVIIEVALAVGNGVEIDAVDDALQQRVQLGELECLFSRIDLLRDTLDFVVEDVTEALGEYES